MSQRVASVGLFVWGIVGLSLCQCRQPSWEAQTSVTTQRAPDCSGGDTGVLRAQGLGSLCSVYGDEALVCLCSYV